MREQNLVAYTIKLSGEKLFMQDVHFLFFWSTLKFIMNLHTRRNFAVIIFVIQEHVILFAEVILILIKGEIV